MNERSPMSRSAALLPVALCALLVAACGGSATPSTTRASSAPISSATTNTSASTSAQPFTAGAPASSAAVSAPGSVATVAPAPAAVAQPGSPTASGPAASTSSGPAAPAVPGPAASANVSPAPAAAAAPVATPAPVTQANATQVGVTLLDTAIKLDRTSAPSGPVTFAIKNNGSVIHEFVVLKTDFPQNQIPVDPSKPGMVSEPGYVAQTPTLTPGSSTTLSLTLASGAYVFLCNQPAHYLIGMHTAFTAN
jgi:uncharacterized cupredoxin-like copper-binding protein